MQREAARDCEKRYEEADSPGWATASASHPPLLKIPVWWRRAVLPSLPWVVCFLSFFRLDTGANWRVNHLLALGFRDDFPASVLRKKERKRTTQGRDGRTARRHHTGILRRGVWCASRRPPLGVRLFLSLFAVPRRFSLQPSCHLAVFPLSSFSLLSLLPLSLRSPLPRSATTPTPAEPLLSRLLSTFGVTPLSLQRVLQFAKQRQKSLSQFVEPSLPAVSFLPLSKYQEPSF